MYVLRTSNTFKKEYLKISKNLHIEIVDLVIKKLLNGEILEPKYKDHALSGKYKGCRECHIKADLLLIYQKQENILVLTILRLGSHSELF